MFLKSLALLLALYIASTNGSEYIYNNQAGGWLKFHEQGTFEDAYIECDTETAVLASPLNFMIRDAIRDFLKNIGKPDATILTGVQANMEDGDYYSVEGVGLEKMPVISDTEVSVRHSNSESCMKWMTGIAEMKVISCDEILPFVCFKKRTSPAIVGCGTSDSEYKFDYRSGSCYKLHTKALPWMDAYKKCKKEDAYLAVNNNPLENRVLKEHFAKYPNSVLINSANDRAFIGIRDWQSGESWRTVKGQSLEDAGFTGWAIGEPDNSNGQDYCVSLNRDGTYHDEDCAISLAYICEKKPEILFNSSITSLA